MNGAKTPIDNTISQLSKGLPKFVYVGEICIIYNDLKVKIIAVICTSPTLRSLVVQCGSDVNF